MALGATPATPSAESVEYLIIARKTCCKKNMSKQETMQNVWSIRATKFKTPIQRGAAVPSEPFHIQKVC